MNLWQGLQGQEKPEQKAEMNRESRQNSPTQSATRDCSSEKMGCYQMHNCSSTGTVTHEQNGCSHLHRMEVGEKEWSSL